MQASTSIREFLASKISNGTNLCSSDCFLISHHDNVAKTCTGVDCVYVLPNKPLIAIVNELKIKIEKL